MTTRAQGAASEKQWEAIHSIAKEQERTVTILDSVVRRMANIENKVDASLTQPALVADISRRLEIAEERVASASKPQYQALSLALAGMVALGTIVGYGINSKINANTAASTNIASVLQEHMSNGHPASVIARIEANKEAIVSQIENNRRESDQQGARIDRLESMLMGYFAKRASR